MASNKFKKIVIKFSHDNTTISIEEYLLDMVAIKHFGDYYQNKKTETNDYVRGLAKKYELSGVSSLREQLILDVVDRKVYKVYTTTRKS